MLSAVCLLAVHLTRFGYQSGTAQLVARAGQTGASLNGEAIHFKAPPMQIQGHTMVPLRETLGLFGLTAALVGTSVTVGNLSFSQALDQATLRGTAIPVEGNLVKVGQDVFVQAKLLADAIGARLGAGEHGEFYLTLVRNVPGEPDLPQPRFVTDKDEYAMGEPVKIEEFSFDPQGQAVNLHWTNRQSAYYTPGPQTITLEAINRDGRGNKLSRTINITDRQVDTPLGFSLKYGVVGDLVDDVSTDHPTLSRISSGGEADGDGGGPLFFSDSPEVVEQPGALFRRAFQGQARLVGYHINGSNAGARLCVAVKNVDTEAGTFRTIRMGDTAPARIEGVLGQVTLMSFLTDRQGSRLQIGPGESALLYVSPTLAPRTGCSFMADLSGDRRFEVTVSMTSGEETPTAESVTASELLTIDLRHARGVFPAAVRRFSLDLSRTLPAKAVIGDVYDDPAEVGEDPQNGAKVVLDGNFGVTYDITLHNARGVIGCLAPRGGLYKGAVVVEQSATGKREIVRLPKEGVLSNPDKPMIFLKSESSVVRLEFIPASGSQMPVHLVFYRG